MRHHRLLQIAGTCSLVFSVAACSGSSTSPTAPSGIDNFGPVTSATISASDAGVSGATNAPAPDRSTVNFEIKFMTDMIDHHQMAIEMAEICVDQAVHEELRAMCRDIIAAQSQEIQRMQSWLQQWYGVSYQPTMKPGDEKMLERLASLSGAEFEIAFMEMMIKHHEKAIKEGEHCLDKAAHAELRQLCENIIATQSAEIAQLQEWLCAWYGRCR